MNKNLTITIIFCFFVSSLFLISSQANAGMPPPPPPPMMKTNCCEPRDSKCEYVREGELGQIAEYECEPVEWGDGDDWGDDGWDGDDDDDSSAGCNDS